MMCIFAWRTSKVAERGEIAEGVVNEMNIPVREIASPIKVLTQLGASVLGGEILSFHTGSNSHDEGNTPSAEGRRTREHAHNDFLLYGSCQVTRREDSS